MTPLLSHANISYVIMLMTGSYDVDSSPQQLKDAKTELNQLTLFS